MFVKKEFKLLVPTVQYGNMLLGIEMSDDFPAPDDLPGKAAVARKASLFFDKLIEKELAEINQDITKGAYKATKAIQSSYGKPG